MNGHGAKKRKRAILSDSDSDTDFREQAPPAPTRSSPRGKGKKAAAKPQNKGAGQPGKRPAPKLSYVVIDTDSEDLCEPTDDDDDDDNDKGPVKLDILPRKAARSKKNPDSAAGKSAGRPLNQPFSLGESGQHSSQPTKGKGEVHASDDRLHASQPVRRTASKGKTGAKQQRPLVQGSLHDAFKAYRTTIAPTATQLAGPTSGKEDGGVHRRGSEPGGGGGGGEAWAEKYQCLTAGTPCVHKKKADEVRKWLKDAWAGLQARDVRPVRKVLCLTGPSGCGKTALVHALARELGFEVCEWCEPPTHYSKDINQCLKSEYESLAEKFVAFLSRAKRYPSLFGPPQAAPKKLVLVEDLSFVSDKSTIPLLRRAVGSYLLDGTFPLVVAWTETNTEATPLPTLLSKQLMVHPNMSHISMNPIASTLMLKALESVCRIEGVKASKADLQALVTSSDGDIRFALNVLQLHHTARAGKPFSARASTAADSEMAPPGAPAHVLDTADRPLDLFHLLGKILYSKRKPASSSSTTEEGDGRGPLENNPEDVIDRGHKPARNLIMYLHENYLSFFEDIEDIEEAADALGQSDLFSNDFKNLEIMSQYASLVAARGIMHANRSPASRKFLALCKPRMYSLADRQQQCSEFIHCLDSSRVFCNGGLVSDRTIYTELLPCYEKWGARMQGINPAFIRAVKSLGTYRRLSSSQQCLRSSELVDEEDGDGAGDECAATSGLRPLQRDSEGAVLASQDLLDDIEEC